LEEPINKSLMKNKERKRRPGNKPNKTLVETSMSTEMLSLKRQDLTQVDSEWISPTMMEQDTLELSSWAQTRRQ
jgi:hypothetical protein